MTAQQVSQEILERSQPFPYTLWTDKLVGAQICQICGCHEDAICTGGVLINQAFRELGRAVLHFRHLLRPRKF